MIANSDQNVSARKAGFIGGLCALLLSLALLLISFANARHIVGYLAQADAAFPYVQRGIFTALCAVCLCCFGKGAPRAIAVLLSSCLMLYWIFLGVTLY